MMAAVVAIVVGAFGMLAGSVFSRLVANEVSAYIPDLTRTLIRYASQMVDQDSEEAYDELWAIANEHFSQNKQLRGLFVGISSSRSVLTVRSANRLRSIKDRANIRARGARVASTIEVKVETIGPVRTVGAVLTQAIAIVVIDMVVIVVIDMLAINTAAAQVDTESRLMDILSVVGGILGVIVWFIVTSRWKRPNRGALQFSREESEF